MRKSQDNQQAKGKVQKQGSSGGSSYQGSHPPQQRASAVSRPSEHEGTGSYAHAAASPAKRRAKEPEDGIGAPPGLASQPQQQLQNLEQRMTALSVDGAAQQQQQMQAIKSVWADITVDTMGAMSGANPVETSADTIALSDYSINLQSAQTTNTVNLFSPLGSQSNSTLENSPSNRSNTLPSTTDPTPSQARSAFGRMTGLANPISIPATVIYNPTSQKFVRANTDPSLDQQHGASSSKDLIVDPNRFKPTLRPNYGEKGRKFVAKVNFFELQSVPKATIWHYKLKVSPEVPPTLNRKIFAEFVTLCKEKLKNAGGNQQLINALGSLVYDGRHDVYSPVKIDLKAIKPFVKSQTSAFDTSLVFELSVRDDYPLKHGSVLIDFTDATQSGQRVFIFQISEVGSVDVSRLVNFMKGTTDQNSISSMVPHDVLDAFDVLMRHRPYMMMTSIGRSFFTRKDAVSLGDGAECWMGFHQSMTAASGRLLMNIDINATTFFEPTSLIVFFAKNLGGNSAAYFDTASNRVPLKPRDIHLLEKVLKGIKVAINHRGEMRRKYKIQSITKTQADQTFFQKDGAEISVAQYFRQQYNIALRYPFLPCLVVGNEERPVFLPVEVCDIVPGQRYLRKLNETQTSAIINLTCKRPQVRSAKITEAIADLGLSSPQSVREINAIFGDEDVEFLGKFGVSLNHDMLQVPARILDPPAIQYHASSREPLLVPHEGHWNLKDKRIVIPATLHNWAIVVFSNPRDVPLHRIEQFVRELINTCVDTGLSITNTYPKIVFGDITQVEASLKFHHDQEVRENRRPQIMLCIMPSNAISLYSEIKRVGDTVLGVPTQCIQQKHTFNAKKQYCANVCLKINVKLGGSNSYLVPNPENKNDVGLPWFPDSPTMVFGADVSHPNHGDHRSSGTTCALVGSLDRSAGVYKAAVRLQPSRREVIMELASMVTELMLKFVQVNSQQKPARVIFYRSGVTDTQIYNVASYEVKAICQAFEQLFPGFQCAITYVIVQKRHHVRIFAANSKDADKTQNVRAGTVVDSHITHPNEYDFYLCSHAGLQGTSRPTHYFVLHDDNHFSADLIQELTYKLCYNYARCTRSVSFVPPAYYAQLVAARAKFHTPGNREILQYQQSVQQSEGSASEKEYPLDDSLNSLGSKAGVTSDEEVLALLKSKLAVVNPALQDFMWFV